MGNLPPPNTKLTAALGVATNSSLPMAALETQPPSCTPSSPKGVFSSTLSPTDQAALEKLTIPLHDHGAESADDSIIPARVVTAV